MYQRNYCIPLMTLNMDRKFNGSFTKFKTFLGTCFNDIYGNINITIHGPTAQEISKYNNLESKTCLITGANSGIGLEMARCLSSRNCNVLMACRNTYAANVVTKNICGNFDRLRFYEINLASLRSVTKFCDDILKFEKRIDIVILNAGTFGLPWTLTEDNFETTFQVNYLSQYYLLTNIDNILTQDARVVFVSSESHRNVIWDTYDKLMPTEEMLSLPKDKYTSIKAYNISKLCGILAMHNLGYRWLYTGKSVFCAHPGSFVKTKLCRNWWPYELLYNLMRPFTKTINQAASTPLYCATSPELKGLSALYYKDCRRCAESELASEVQLSFRINDLTREMISDRLGDTNNDVTTTLESPHNVKITDAIDETVVSNCSG